MTSVSGVIYRITHRESGRCYIGQTTGTLANRWRQHQRQSVCTLLHRAIVKYGADAFDVECIGLADNKLALDALERFWIGAHLATDRAHGFNLREGGSFGRHSEESRTKMSLKVREALAGTEYRKKLSQSQMGRVVTAETRERIAKSNTGKRHSEATKALLSERRKEMWRDPQIREAMTAKQTAIKRSPEARAAAAEKAKAQWADPERRRKGLEALAAARAKRHSNT